VGAETEQEVKNNSQEEAVVVSIHISCYSTLCIAWRFISCWVSFFIFYVNKNVMG